LALAVTSLPGASSPDGGAVLSTVTIGGSVNATGSAQFGAGEIVGRGPDGTLLVLTARHVVNGLNAAPRIYLHDDVPSGSWVQRFFSPDGGRSAQIVAVAHKSDLALLAFVPEPDDRYAVARFASANPGAGTVVGAPYGAAWTTSRFSLVEAPAGRLIVRCAQCGPGDSGGGVFDAGGHLAGILIESQDHVVGGRQVPTGIYRAISLGPARQFVANATVPEGAAQPLARVTSNAWSRFHADRSGP
jgi:hypothetical protein